MTAPQDDAEFAWDVLGLGCVAVDDLLHVPAYPPSDAKAGMRAAKAWRPPA